MKILRFFALAASFAVWTACFSPVNEHICDEHTPCGSGYVCVNGVCLPPNGNGGGGGEGGGSGGGTGGGSLGGGPGGGGGGGSMCFDGCIDSFGQCRQGTTASQCGTHGDLCIACGTNEHCEGGSCVAGCGAQSCAGCCAGGSRCLPFSQQGELQCGNGGATCDACPADARCVVGRCVGGTCNAASCPNGCCQNGLCVDHRFQSAFACGDNGASCNTCPRGETCTNGVCGAPQQCNPMTCPNGCCLNGICVPGSAQNRFACGAGGNTCMQCGMGGTCSNGACSMQPSCNSNNCAGCCDGNNCRMGTTNNRCGIKGLACVQCSRSESCEMGSCQPQRAEVGAVCSSDGDCSTLGATAYCKLRTSSGNASYSDGYCTLRCTGAPSQSSCPMGSFCLSVPNRGEDDNFCADRCGFQDNCRSPGYACYGIQGQQNTNVCWLFPAPPVQGFDAGTGGGGGSTFDGGGFGGGVGGGFGGGFGGGIGGGGGFGGGTGGGSSVDAGVRTLGGACSSSTQCAGLAGPVCIPASVPGFGATGYVDGYCTTSCGAGSFCPQNGMCITETFFGNSTSTCKSTCPGPGMGQSTCRSGYLCHFSPTGALFDGGIPPGWCGPRCDALLGQCSAGTRCGMDGYCR